MSTSIRPLRFRLDGPCASFSRVIRFPLSRLTALVLAVVAGSAAPISALAHGYAHRHEAVEHDPTDAHLASAGSATGGQHVASLHNAPVAESQDHSGEKHPHLNVGAALTMKSVPPFVAFVALRIAVPVARVVTIADSPADRIVRPRGDPAHAPPPRLRGPPTFVG